MLKYILIGVAILLIYAQVDKTNSNTFIVMARDIGTKLIDIVKGLISPSKSTTGTNTPSTPIHSDGVTIGNKTVLGPVYQPVSCMNDLECQGWYKCSGCSCDTSNGKCWYYTKASG